MALEINEQYRKFVQFAEQQKQAGNEKAITDALAACGQKETVRFEQLDMETLLRLTDALFAKGE